MMARKGVARTKGNIPAILSKNIFIFKTSKRVREKYPDAFERFNILKKKPRLLIKLTKHLFDFGFTLDDRDYYIRSSGIIGEHWTSSLDSVIDRGESIPKVYAGINNLLAIIQEAMEGTKTDLDAWIGDIWSRKDEPEHGLIDATIARMNAYTSRQEETIEFKYQHSELKGIHLRLKGLLKILDMQHAQVVAMIYHSRKSDSIFQDAVGSMVNRDTTIDAEYTEEDVVKLRLKKKKKKKKKKRG